MDPEHEMYDAHKRMSNLFVDQGLPVQPAIILVFFLVGGSPGDAPFNIYGEPPRCLMWMHPFSFMRVLHNLAEICMYDNVQKIAYMSRIYILLFAHALVAEHAARCVCTKETGSIHIHM